jgi:hypothetical protein
MSCQICNRMPPLGLALYCMDEHDFAQQNSANWRLTRWDDNC